MADIDIKLICSRCKGSGLNDHVKDEEGNPLNGPCPTCTGAGWLSTEKLDITEIETAMGVLEAKLDANTVEIDAINSYLAGIHERVGSNIAIDTWGYSSVTQGSFARVLDDQWYQGKYLESVGPLDGDQVNYRVFMVAGTYTITVIHAKSFLMGIMKVLIDGSEEVSADCYVDVNSTEFDAETTTYGVVVPTTGFKVISFKVDGKNPLSSNYYINVSALFLDKTA